MVKVLFMIRVDRWCDRPLFFVRASGLLRSKLLAEQQQKSAGSGQSVDQQVVHVLPFCWRLSAASTANKDSCDTGGSLGPEFNRQLILELFDSWHR